ncbi:SEC-C motif-containing protein [Bisgaardia hudsonensis]|uniref:SEC-C motif-containing protein n=1 Tax=Bisgaardia hudsonensis TaxID=109472 RepID=A0A4R2MUF6_9PAST|nr:YchJ family protein [Bisgaardia hudsonensis]TCP12310.1 SEC-C motif-containing protein [Bisgaardia hudsonensis]
MTALCPCQYGKQYQDCCGLLHSYQIRAKNAEQLMRSRYSAFVINNIDYIVATTIPSQQPLLDIEALTQWSLSAKWQGLEIVEYIDKLTSNHSAVEFKAFFIQNENLHIHHEKSLFVRINDVWYFADPTVNLPTMKKPCICGSGKKFKSCCGEMLWQFYLAN